MFITKGNAKYTSVGASLFAILGCISSGFALLPIGLLVLVIANIHTALSLDAIDRDIQALEQSKYRLKGV
jgi:uncharacterized membrane protein